MFNQFDGKNHIDQNAEEYNFGPYPQKNQRDAQPVHPYVEQPPVQNNTVTYAQRPMSSYQAPAPQKEKKKTGNRIAMFLAAIILAGAAGFGGSAIEKQFNGSSQSNPSVIKQSVVNNSANQDIGAGGIAEVANATSGSVVEIKTEQVQTSAFMQQYTASGAGSGVIISSDGYIVTNNHVVNGADKITVTMNNGEVYDAKLVGTDEATDIAVLKINADHLPAAVLGDSDSLRVGDLALAIGNPLGELGGTVTDGIISALDRDITIDNQQMTLLQTSAAVNPGNSGGGLFNSKGELVGIVNAKSSGSEVEGLGFAIPINIAKPVIEDLIQNGYVTGRIKLGLSFIDVTTQEMAMQYRVEELGAYVYQVNEGSDADRAGLRSGDLVYSVDGTKVYQSSEIKKLLADYKVGDKIKLLIKRDGQEIELEVTFTEYMPQTS